MKSQNNPLNKIPFLNLLRIKNTYMFLQKKARVKSEVKRSLKTKKKKNWYQF
jgi:hypothetical protein